MREARRERELAETLNLPIILIKNNLKKDKFAPNTD